MGDPVEQEGIRAGFSCGAGRGYCLWPSGGPVVDSKYKGKTMRRWKRAHEIYVDMTEGIDKNRHFKDRRVVVLDDFAQLAETTGLNPGGDDLPHTKPDKPVADQPL